MKRSFLLAAASTAPLFLLAALPAHALDSITGSTSTPVATATATNNAPDSIDIASGGSVGPSSAGVAVTVNSSNPVTNEGSINFTSVNNATGVQLQGGNTSSFTSTGSISVTDSYTPSTDNNTGLQEPAFAQGSNRTGIQVVGPGIFHGAIYNYGSITVHGDNSFGVSIQAPISGDYQSLQYTAASGSTAASVLTGQITVLGGEPSLNGAPATPPVIGFQVTPTGGVGGNVTLGYVSATGYGAQAVSIGGAVAGAVNFTGVVTATGYETTSRSSYPSIASQYTAMEMLQGGPVITIGANVGGGVVFSAPPLDAITNSSTTNDVINGQQIIQTAQPTASVTSFGASPALVIGSGVNSVSLGVVNSANNTVLGPDATTSAGGYGLVNEGAITGNGVFDQVNYPNLPSAVSATAIQIGATPTGSSTPYAAVIQGGVLNTGSIEAQAYQGNATAIHVMAGGATPLFLNDGIISGSAIQENTATSGTGVGPLNVYGLLIESGATVNSVVNNSGIIANLTGDAGVGGSVGAIVDRSGTLTSITNTGTISAQGTQTLITQPMPVNVTAIDISNATVPQTITQSLSTNSTVTGAAAYNIASTYSQGQIVNYNGIVYQATNAAGTAVDPVDYPSYWREIGATAPFVSGSILFGTGGGNLTVTAGTVNGAIINLGPAIGGSNVLTVAGPAGGSLSATSVTGAIEEVAPSVAESQVSSGAALMGGGNGTLTINVNNGSLTDTNPNKEYVSGVNVGANGLLLIAADPAHNTYTTFVASGSSTFAQGAQIGVTLLSIPVSKSNTYTVLETTGAGTLTAGTFATGLVSNAPWLYNANAAYVPATAAGGPSAIDLTVTEKTTAQLGFNHAEAAALDAVLAAAPSNPGIQNALLAQYTQSGLKSVYDQLLPNQGQGLFDSLDSAAQAIGSMVSTAPEAASRVAGTSLWLQQVNERVDRSGLQTDGSFSKLFGVVGGYDVSGAGGGTVGLTLAYLNASELGSAQQLGTGVVASMVEAGLYYRRTAGRFSVSARAGIGYSWFDENRIFAVSTTTNNSTTGTELKAHASWGGLFYDGHFQAAYEQPLGRFYIRPELSADFLQLNEGSYSESGGGAGFDLNVASRDSNRLSGQAIMVVGRQWGQAAWLRTELRGGYREVLAGAVGDTTASFGDGNPFSLAPDSDKGGWVTVGFSLKGGSQYSYLALEGDADFRDGEQRYDLRVAGRSIF